MANEVLTKILDEQLVARKERDPHFPWEIVKKIVEQIVASHPEIILIFTQQVGELLQEVGEVLPEGYMDGDIAGEANPVLVEVRTKLEEVKQTT